MKRSQRINRVSRKRSERSSKLLPIVLILAAGVLVLQLVFVGILVTTASATVYRYYNRVAVAGLDKLRSAPKLVDIQPTKILDRYGRLLWEVSDTSRGLHKDVPLSRIPLDLQEAIVATEDHTFWTNPGLDPKATVRAFLLDLAHRQALEGASGITQQIVKRLVLTNQPSFQRKIQEALISIAVARPHSGFSKAYILSLYLNTVFFGHEAYGVEAAARVFFGKHVWQLDLAQCALLAGLVQAPSYYDPLGPYGPQPALNRMHIVLGRMLTEGYITADQMHQAVAEANKFVFSEPGWSLTTSRSAAPYWTDWIEHLLTYGSAPDVKNGWYTDPLLANVVATHGGFASGLTIRTTLDLNMYDKAQQTMNDKVNMLAGYNVNDAAVVVLDPHSSECLAMVGGLDYYSKATGSQINMAAHPRSPGSSFKLFTYLTAFKQGWTPATMILDEPQTWPDPSEPSGVYAPRNYDLSWHGAVTLRIALANSFNLPAIKTISAVGIPNVLRTAEDMGLSYLRGQESRAGLSLTLGSIPVPLWQMAQGYNIVANGGIFRPMASILSIKDAGGNTIYSYKTPAGVQVIAPQYAYLITSILKDNYARVLAFGYNTPLRLDYPLSAPAAVKTGTSQFFKDNLTIGFTPNLLTATWVGNPDDTSMYNVEGVDGAGPIWHDFMEWALQYRNLPVLDFTSPPGILLARVSSSGYLADSRTAWPITDLFAAGTAPHQYDSGYGETYTRYRLYRNDFSVDGGTSGSALAGPVPVAPLAPISGTTPISGSVPSGYSGLLSQRPSDPNLCGGRSYTYTSVYVNGQLMWRYVCQ